MSQQSLKDKTIKGTMWSAIDIHKMIDKSDVFPKFEAYWHPNFDRV